MITLFNTDWEFQLKGDDAWRAVSVPHDWLIADTKNLYADGIGRYRKYWEFDTAYPRKWLSFDGVYMDSTLYINGEKAGEWKNGYTAFSHEITPFIRPGVNEILLEVNHQSPNSRWYSGAGLYRDCRLVEMNTAHIPLDGVYISTVRENNTTWRVHADVELSLDETEDKKNYELRYHVAQPLSPVDVGRGGVLSLDLSRSHISSFDFPYENPNIWDIHTAPGFCGPSACYTLVTTLLLDGTVLDKVYTRFGFRESIFSPDGGFTLNGRRTVLYGVCQHHDLGALGAAFNKDALRRQLEILRDMGANAIRTAHNPPAQAFMTLADEMGFLVQSEFSDMWKRPKTPYDYARFFDEWASSDVAAWVRRDRNNPSLFMWSIGNEINDTHADYADGAATMRFLMDEVARHDPRRNAHPTLCTNYIPWENTQKCADMIKLVGYNYADYLYHKHHAQYPDWVLYGSETASHVQSRGVYHFPLATPILCDDDMQCSALGNATTSWGAKNPEAAVFNHQDAPFALGQFIWTGFDYIGEPTPYRTKNSYFGQIDTAGFPKDTYYIYQAAWTPFEARPVLHLFPHWDWNPGQLIDVRIASNAPRVELFVNGISQGVREPRLTADYIVPYKPGEIKAVAYDAQGNIILEEIRRSFGDTVALRTRHKTYGALTFWEITAADRHGNPVENANTRVRVTARRGTLLALDNGDSTDYDAYQPPYGENTLSRRMFNGKLLAITKNTNHDLDLSFEINPAYIPVRKIEITQGDNFTFTARIFPPDASDDTLHWRITNVSGNDSPLATLTADGKTASFHPKGDGWVYIRCAAHNGKPHADIISVLPVTLEGFGKPLLDPYAFVSGGLHTLSNAPMANGNERGVATLNEGESRIGFADVDFGPYGSDEITVWLFAMDSRPFDFEIHLGTPEDNRHLYTARYDKGTVWDTYLPAVYTLPERLTGIHTLTFVFKGKLHMKGFQFTPPQRAFIQHPFAAHDEIYGDTYTLTENTVENIGNNVSIAFKDMDFTHAENGTATHITLSWRATRDNTVRLVFTPDAPDTLEAPDEVINLLTLSAQDAYTSARLPLETALHGRGTLRFIFLPGTLIDMAWFKMG